MDDWALGIDVGTSRSAGAVANGTVSPLEVEGNRWMSSMVLLDTSGSLVVGMAADDQAEIHPDRVERTPKRHLGGTTPLLLGDTAVEVEDAVARIIEVFLDEGRRRHGGSDPSVTVLTHPVRWGEDRKAALVDAAGRAGLRDPGLFTEPVAAAVHYVDERVEVGEYVGIYDLGGGTFDTAVLQRTAEGFAVVGAPGGDESIGGEHFDHLVYEYLGECLGDIDAEMWEQVQYGEDRRWIRAAADLLAQARRAKEAVSSYPSIQVLLPLVDRDVVFTRPQFEAMIRGSLETTVTAMAATIDSAGLVPGDLAAIYLVGGSSRIPLVTDLMTVRFGDRITTRDEPKSVVALGAATCARVLSTGRASPRGSVTASAAGPVDPAWSRELHVKVHGVATDDAGIWATLADGTLHYLDAGGNWRWSMRLPGVAYGPPVPVGGLVFVGTDANAVVAVDRNTATERWRAATRAPVVPAPLVVGDLVIAVDDGGMVAAFARHDGVLRWLLPLGVAVRAGLCLAGSTLFVAGIDGRVFRVDAATGRVAWAFPVPASVTATPLATGDAVVPASVEGVVYGVDAISGSARWGTRLDGGVAGPAGPWGVGVVVVDRSGTLSVIDRTTGVVQWSVGTGGTGPSGVVVAGGNAAVDNGDGELVVVDLLQRSVTRRVRVEPGSWQTPIVAGERVLAVSGTSVLAVDLTA